MSNVVVAFPLLILMSAVIFLPILVGIYVYRDANRRGMNAVLWTIIAILAPSLIGFIIYLLVRGNYSNLKCPRCETVVTEQYVVCPKCGAKLRPSCPNCSTPIEPDWTVCPKCAQPLPTVQEDIVTPVRPKDRTLWKILVAIIVVPVILLLALGISFSAASGGGSSSLQEVTFDEYYADQEIPDSTKEYVREWLAGLELRSDRVYALQYEHQLDPQNKSKDYYYLVFVPGGGEASHQGFGYSSGLFSSSTKLTLDGTNGQDGLYCVATTAKNGAPKLKVTLNGETMSAEVTEVEFNPTLYTIASESDYSALKSASGDLYVESEEREMQPELATFTKYVDGQQYGVAEFDAPDFLLDTIVGIHELHYLEKVPAVLQGYELNDYYTITILFVDDTGKSHYEDTYNYLIVATEESYYLLEIGMYGKVDDVLTDGQISTNENIFVYEISANSYADLAALFVKS